MTGYYNKFDIAKGMLYTPQDTLKAIQKEEKYRNNVWLGRIIKLMLRGFRKWSRIAVVSGLKGLNPFTSDKDAVEHGYYDYRKTKEFSMFRNMVATELGINEAYFREDILKKYAVIQEMYRNNPKALEALELTVEEFFHDNSTNLTLEVLGNEQMKKLMEGLKEYPEYESLLKQVVVYQDEFGTSVVDANHEMIRSFLEKDYLSREFTAPEQKKGSVFLLPPPKQGEFVAVSTEQGLVQAEVKEKDGWKYYQLPGETEAVLHRYIGTEENLSMPTSIDGISVQSIGSAALMDAPIKTLTIDAAYWTKERLNPAYLRTSGEQAPAIHWLNLSEQQKNQLKENKNWAEEIQEKNEMQKQVKNIAELAEAVYHGNLPKELAVHIGDKYATIRAEENYYDCSILDENLNIVATDSYNDMSVSISVALADVLEEAGLSGKQAELVDYEKLQKKMELEKRKEITKESPKKINKSQEIDI